MGLVQKFYLFIGNNGQNENDENEMRAKKKAKYNLSLNKKCPKAARNLRLNFNLANHTKTESGGGGVWKKPVRE